MGFGTALFHATRPINSRRTPLLGFPRPRSLRPAARVDITIANFGSLCKGWLYGPSHHILALPLHPALYPVYEGAMKSPRMDMRSSLAHLPARKQRELERILTILHEEFGEAVKASTSPTRRAGRILKIILFGSHARDDWVEDPKGGYFSDYDLLVIVNETELAEMSVYWYTAEDRILNARAIKTPVSFIVHSLEEVNDALGQGEYFFADIVTDGILLYELNGKTAGGNKRYTLVQPKPPTPQAAYERAKTYFEFWTDQADEAFKSYRAIVKDGVVNYAAFTLHQTIERIYNTLLLTLTLYSPKTHNIKFLRSLAEDQDKRLIEAWPRATKRDRATFELLKKAYIEARYSEHYQITKAQLDWLAESSTRLQALVETSCTERLETLKAEATWNGS